LSNLPSSLAISAFLVLLCVSLLNRLNFKYIVYIRKKKDHVLNNYPKILTYLAIIIILFISIYWIYSYINSNYIFPEPPKDHLIVSISPFVLDNSEVDFDTAKEMKEKIESSTDGRIDAIVLNSPPVTNNEEAIKRGKKCGANLVIYGGQKKKLGDLTEIYLYIAPIYFKPTQVQSKVSNINNSENFETTFSPYTSNPVSITESLTENVSSTVLTICAFEYYNEAKYNLSLNTFKSIRDYGNEYPILHYAANCYFIEGNYEEAIKLYNKAIEKNPKFFEAWHNKALSLDYLGNFKEAIKAYDKAIEINPQNATVWSDKAAALGNSRNYEEAIDACDKAIEIDPNCINAWYNKGLALQNLGSLQNLGKFQEAINAYNKTIEINPQFIRAWYHKGLSLQNLGKFQEAIDAYNKTIEIDPNCIDAWNSKGLILFYSNRYEEAIKAYDKAIEINPKYVDAWNNKGNALRLSGRPKEATEVFDRAIEIKAYNSDTWLYKGNALAEQQNYTEAIKAYDRAIEMNPQEALFWYQRACAYSSISDREQTLYNLKHTIELDSSYKGLINNHFKALSMDKEFRSITNESN
jgi:Putative Zn-dependent protease, contains TPR repeats